MKQVLFLLLFLVLLGCNKEPTTPAEPEGPRLSESFDLRIGEWVSLKGENLAFQFVYVPADSRCPEGAICIWGGNAAVVIKISDVQDTLNTSIEPKASSYYSYTITLLNLSPYPKVGVPRDTTQYIARFVVAKE